LLRGAAEHFSTTEPGEPPPPALLAALDRALRLTLDGPAPAAELGAELISTDPAQGRAALVAMRRNLFPQAPAFLSQPPALEPQA
jgi:hypothetical protein